VTIAARDASTGSCGHVEQEGGQPTAVRRIRAQSIGHSANVANCGRAKMAASQGGNSADRMADRLAQRRGEQYASRLHFTSAAMAMSAPDARPGRLLLQRLQIRHEIRSLIGRQLRGLTVTVTTAAGAESFVERFRAAVVHVGSAPRDSEQ
jgi:hypothetical protein